MLEIYLDRRPDFITFDSPEEAEHARRHGLVHSAARTTCERRIIRDPHRRKVDNALRTLNAAVEQLATIDTTILPAEVLSELVIERSKLTRQLEASEASMLADWDAAKAWRVNRASSAPAWLGYKAGMGPKEAGAKMALARNLCAMPHTRSAFESGDISTDHVKALARINVRRTQHAFARDEADLVAKAASHTWRGFTKAIGCWQMHEDQDGPDPRPDNRGISYSKNLDDTFHIDGNLDHIEGAAVEKALQHEVDQLCKLDWQEAKDRLGHEPFKADLQRTPYQRRADALVNLIKRGAAKPDQLRRPLVNVLVGYESIAGPICELFNGTQLRHHEVAALLSEADIQRVVFNGPDTLLSMGATQRFFRGNLRKAIQIRDRVCAGAMCDMPADRCDIDHLIPYPDGPTNHDNAQTLCRTCHGYKTAADQRAKSVLNTPEARHHLNGRTNE